MKLNHAFNLLGGFFFAVSAAYLATRAAAKPSEKPAALNSAIALSVTLQAPPRQPRRPLLMTYCPGPNCALSQKAKVECERRPGGVFSAEPDFVCTLGDGLHRMVCDDVDDEHQCGMMSHSDLEYARLQLEEYVSHLAKYVPRADFTADLKEGKMLCTESPRAIVCTFTDRSTGKLHEQSPLTCNWMGCALEQW